MKRDITKTRCTSRLRTRVTACFFACVYLTDFAHAEQAQVKECPELRASDTIRIATFNTSLSHKKSGAMFKALQSGKHKRAHNIAHIIQRIRPDIILLNEFDYDTQSQAAHWFNEKYLKLPSNDTFAIEYPYSFSAPSNTGLDSGFDLDNNGKTGGPADAFGFGQFPGQYGMLVLSRFPIDHDKARQFQTFKWKDMPNALIPIDWYTTEEIESLRLSSKNHWDLPIVIKDDVVNEQVLNVLASHPTPPVFDGPEDRNGKRNHDEIRFWADYINDTAMHGSSRSAYMTDDTGLRGGIGNQADRFVIVGDLNADPIDGDSHNQAATLLTQHPLINNDLVPASRVGVRAAAQQGGVNTTHQGDPQFDTGDFSDTKAGNLRVDYVLPSRAGLELVCASVYWPTDQHVMSDHRPVFIDVRMR